MFFQQRDFPEAGGQELSGTVRGIAHNFSLAPHVTYEKALTDEVLSSGAKLLTLQILPRFNQSLSTPITDRSLSSGKMFKRYV